MRTVTDYIVLIDRSILRIFKKISKFFCFHFSVKDIACLYTGFESRKVMRECKHCGHRFITSLYSNYYTGPGFHVTVTHSNRDSESEADFYNLLNK